MTGGRMIDLSAAIAEEASETVEVKISKDLTLSVPSKLPFAAIEAMSGSTAEDMSIDPVVMLTLILGEDGYASLKAAGLNLNQAVVVMEHLMSEVYGTEPGK